MLVHMAIPKLNLIIWDTPVIYKLTVKMVTRYSGVYDSMLLTLNPRFNPKNPSPKEKELYVSAFLDWVKYDDLGRVPRYLETLSANERDADGNSALHYCKSLAMLDLLLSHGADVLAKNKKNVQPIVTSRSLEILRKFLEVMRSADPAAVPDLNDPSSNSGVTFFQILIEIKSFELVEWLLEDEKNAQELGLSPPKPFHFVNDNFDTMKMAIKADAPQKILKIIHDNLPKDYKMDDFQLFLTAGVFGGRDGIIFFAGKIQDFDQEFSDNKVTVFSCAASFLNIESCKALLEIGANPNKKCGNNCCSAASALIICSKKGGDNVEKALEILKLMSEHGATFSEFFQDGRNLLRMAVDSDAKIFEIIASKTHSSYFLLPYEGDKLIHLASKKTTADFLKVLFKYSPPGSIYVNEKSQTYREETPIAAAASKGSRECCMFLLQNGANPDIEVKKNTASQVARCYGNEALADELETFETEKSFCCC